MATPPPKTARELCALIESLLPGLSPLEQRRFWELITHHPQNKSGAVFRDALQQLTAMMGGPVLDLTDHLQGQINDLAKKLKKHRKPATMAERDAEIRKLRKAGKTSGEIVLALRSKYPEITTSKVRGVLSRKPKDGTAHGS